MSSALNYSSDWRERLGDWVYSDEDEPVDSGIMTELRTEVANTVIGQDPERLTALEHLLSPLAAHLAQRLASRDIPRWISHAAELPVLAVMARLARNHITWIDPEKSLARIRHGEAILRLLLTECATRPEHSHRDDMEVRLDDWAKALGRIGGRPLSTSTVSRVLKALEQAGFIQLTGTTRDRRCVLLAKARAWEKEHARPAVQEAAARPAYLGPRMRETFPAVPEDEDLMERSSARKIVPKWSTTFFLGDVGKVTSMVPREIAA